MDTRLPVVRIWPDADQLMADDVTVVLPPGLRVRKPAPTVLVTVKL
jgi:hypothetical protein